MRYKLLTLGVLACTVGAFALFGQAAVPQNMNVQGKLTDAAGDPLGPGNFVFTFKIFDMAAGGVEIWPAGPGEVQSVSTDANGTWNAILGSVIALPPEVFSDTSRWLEFTVDDGVLPPETLTRIKLNMSPYAGRAESSKAADNGVPVGAVIDWWRPNATFPVPDGFQICDGSMVVDPESPLNGLTLPDLRNRFVRGANVIGDIGLTGGTDSHAHSVDAPITGSNSVNLAHSHSHDHPAHGLSITSDSHTHFHDHPNTTSTITSAHEARLRSGLDANHFHVSSHGHNVNLIGISSSTDTHAHSGIVDLFNISSSSSLGSHAHSTNIAPFNSASTGNLPSYATLLKIMRIK